MTCWRTEMPRSVELRRLRSPEAASQELRREALAGSIAGSWAEDRATRGRDLSADPGPRPVRAARCRPSAHRDWPESDKSIPVSCPRRATGQTYVRIDRSDRSDAAATLAFESGAKANGVSAAGCGRRFAGRTIEGLALGRGRRLTG